MTDQQDITQEELLPCPFCNGKAIIEERVTDIVVKCGGIGCYTQQRCTSIDRVDAIHKWNTRAEQG